MTDHPGGAAPIVTSWDHLPLLLHTEHMIALYGVSAKTITRWTRNGHVPLPCVVAGNIRRWDRELIREHLTRRQGLR